MAELWDRKQKDNNGHQQKVIFHGASLSLRPYQTKSFVDLLYFGCGGKFSAINHAGVTTLCYQEVVSGCVLRRATISACKLCLQNSQGL